MRICGLVLLAPLLSGGCAAEERPGARAIRERPDCGLAGAFRQRAEQRRERSPSSRRDPLLMSFPTAACTLPTLDEVALACRVPVRRVRCHFRDARQTTAGCRFEAAVPEWRAARADFTFRFSVGGDGGVHADYFAIWIADRACRFRGREGADASSRRRRWTWPREQA